MALPGVRMNKFSHLIGPREADQCCWSLKSLVLAPDIAKTKPHPQFLPEHDMYGSVANDVVNMAAL